MRAIKGYEGLYAITKRGEVWSQYKGAYLVPVRTKFGYFRVDLHKEGKGTLFLIHRLVLIAYVGLDLERPQCNHIDGNKGNNCLDNLEWSTRSENQQHAIRTGLREGVKGEQNHLSLLSEDDVLSIRGNKDLSQKELALKYGVDPSNISKILGNITWRHIL